jgi:Domain of unknown function (DUF4129)
LWSRKLLAFILILLMVAGFVTAVFANSPPRQVDPSQVFEEVPWAQGVYEFYSSVLAATASGNFANSTSLLALSGFLHIPSSFYAPVRVFDNDIGTFNSQVQKLDQYLNETSRSLHGGFVFESNSSLTLSRIQIHRANATLATMESDAVTFASREGIPPALLLPKVQALQSLLQTKFQTYDSQVQQYDVQLIGLLQGTLHVTHLTVSVNDTAPLVGSGIAFTGQLVDNNTKDPVPGATVRVLYQGKNLTSAVTDGAGFYSGSARIPGVYRANTTVSALFSSDWRVTDLFPSRSQNVTLNPRYFVPTLSASVPLVAPVDGSMPVNGSVSYGGAGLPGVPVTVYAFNESYTGTTGPLGAFDLSVPTPVDVTGRMTLLVATSGSGPYAPVNSTFTTDVEAYVPSVNVDIPHLVVSGLPLRLTGTVTVDGDPLPHALLQFVGTDTNVQATADGQGRFNVTLSPSLLIFSGDWNLQARVFPQQPWVQPSTVKLSIFVLNPLFAVYPVVGVVVVARVMRGRRRSRAASILFPQPAAPEPAAPEVVLPMPEHSKVLEVYSDAVALAGRVTGTSPRTSQTLREYLAEVRGELPGAESFAALTTMAEASLYGGTGDTELLVARDALAKLRRANNA